MHNRVFTKELLFKELYNRHNGKFPTLKDLPFPHRFKDMQRAIKRVKEAIKCGEKIAIVGDYDVDGTVSTTIMRELFKTLQYEIEWIIPNRFKDGYGLSKGVIERLDTDLIITVDNGIAATEAAKECKQRGIDLIITDHHTLPPVLPEAFAIVNQKQKDCNFAYKEVCGAQIAWYFAAALAKELGVKLNTKELLGVCSLAIVADIMPLTGINRAMLLAGIAQLKRSQKPFIKALKNKGLITDTFNSESIAFYIAPLINSAGRLADASLASDFLFTSSLSEAEDFLEQLLALNDERKEIEKSITAKALKQVNPNDSIAVVWGENWHEGVIGIVASKVAEHYHIPAIVFSCKDGICKGSGRSYGNCDLYELTSSAREYYRGFGGHKSALGVGLKEDKLEVVKRVLNIKASTLCNKEFVDKTVLGQLTFGEIDFELLEILEKFEPYGEQNPKPKFTATGVEILNCKDVGKTKEHRSYYLKQANSNFRAIEFRSQKKRNQGDRVNIVYSIGRNIYKGNSTINLFIESITN